MALNYTLKREKVMDGDDEIATVRGLSLNDIIGLLNMNKEAMTFLFDQFKDRDPLTITEGEIDDVGMQMIESAPMLVAQIIAEATDAYAGWDESDPAANPLNLILTMPVGVQMAFIEPIGRLTFSAGGGAKKMLALAMKAVQGGSQSASPQT